jgi:transposase-like protein
VIPKAISFKKHHFSPDIIRHSVWLYFRFTLSFRDVEEMLAQRGIDVSYETAWAEPRSRCGRRGG